MFLLRELLLRYWRYSFSLQYLSWKAWCHIVSSVRLDEMQRLPVLPQINHGAFLPDFVSLWHLYSQFDFAGRGGGRMIRGHQVDMASVWQQWQERCGGLAGTTGNLTLLILLISPGFKLRANCHLRLLPNWLLADSMSILAQRGSWVQGG